MKRKPIRRRDKVSGESRSDLLILSRRALSVGQRSVDSQVRTIPYSDRVKRTRGDRHVRLITRFWPPRLNPADKKPIEPETFTTKTTKKSSYEREVQSPALLRFIHFEHFCA
jgi:hypothetical protein